MSLEHYRPGHDHQPATWAPRAAKPAKPASTEPVFTSQDLFNVCAVAAVAGFAALVLWIAPFDSSTCVGKSCRSELITHVLKYFGYGLLWVFVITVAALAIGAVGVVLYAIPLMVKDAFKENKVYAEGDFISPLMDGVIQGAALIGGLYLLYWAFIGSTMILFN